MGWTATASTGLTGAARYAVATAAVTAAVGLVGWGQQDRVDDVEDAIARCHVGAGDLGVVHGDCISVGYAQFDGIEGIVKGHWRGCGCHRGMTTTVAGIWSLGVQR